MGIDGIDILKPDEFTPTSKVREGEVVSQYIHEEGHLKYVYGWDTALQSFYLQVHDSTRSEEERIIVWLGATADTRMSEVRELVYAAETHGLLIGHAKRGQLQAEKDRGL